MANPVLTNKELEELIDCVMHYGPFARRAVTHDIHTTLREAMAWMQNQGDHHSLREFYEYRDQLQNYPRMREVLQAVLLNAPPHPSTAEVEVDPDTETSEPASGLAAGHPLNNKEVAMSDGTGSKIITLLGAMGLGIAGICCGCSGNSAVSRTVGAVAGWWSTDEVEDNENEEAVVDLESPWQSPLACDGLTPTCPWMNGGSGETLDEVYAFPLRGDRDRFTDEANGCVRLDRNAAGEDVYVVLEPCTAVESGDRASSCPEGQTCLVWTGPEGNLGTIHRGCLQSALGEPSTWEGSCPIISVRDR